MTPTDSAADVSADGIPLPGAHEIESSESTGNAPRLVSAWIRVVQLLGLFAFTFTSWRLAWMSDDALITVRTALNANSGMGLAFNVDERVEAYTHPLWFGVVWATGAVFGSWIYALLYVSLALSVLAVGLLLWQTIAPARLLFVLMGLLLSNSVVEWSSSGLEGPLAMLLVALAWLWFTADGMRRRPVYLGLLLAALVLTRMDFLLLVVPIISLILWRSRSDRRALGMFAAGLLGPVGIWLAFSFSYYGFLLPATYEAKTNTTIPRLDLVGRGLEYIWQSSLFDVAGIGAVLAALVLSVTLGTNKARAWMFGVVLYLGYAAWVGGDFMLGRFTLVPVFVSLLVVGVDSWARVGSHAKRSANWALGFAAVAVVVIAGPKAYFFSFGTDGPQFTTGANGVSDERAVWVNLGRGLDPLVSREVKKEYIPTSLPDLESFAQNWSSVPAISPRNTFVACGALGNAGLWAGPSVHVIDSCGLTDRFLASIPYAPNGLWRAGHFERLLPNGYEDAVKFSDPNRIDDPVLRRRLIALWQVIR